MKRRFVKLFAPFARVKRATNFAKRRFSFPKRRLAKRFAEKACKTSDLGDLSPQKGVSSASFGLKIASKVKLLSYFTFLILSFNTILAQKGNPIEQDPCAEELERSVKETFNKAFDAFSKGDYTKSVGILRGLNEDAPELASVPFLLGVIGVVTDRPTMIEKYFPQVLERCPEFEHPLLSYYMGVIEYSAEHYAKAASHFNRFLEQSEQTQTYEDLQNDAINYLNWCAFLFETTEKRFPFRPKKIENIASGKGEILPSITLDESLVFFFRKIVSIQKDDDSFYRKADFKQTQVLCVATKDTLGEYDTGFPIGETEYFSFPMSRVSLTSDNRTMYFSKPTKSDGETSFDIYCSENVDGVWSEPKLAKGGINSKTANEIAPCISPDGNTIYFSSNRTGGIGGYDIYVSRKDKDGLWSDAVNLGRRVNSPGDELNPYLHPDHHNLYFSSQGWKTIGGSDVFHIDLEDIKMKQPQNLGADLNSENDETELYLLSDGKTAYASVFDSASRTYNICTFPIPEKAWAEEVYLLSGKTDVLSEEDNSCRISLAATSRKTTVNYESHKQDGFFRAALLKGEDYFLKAEKEGYAYYSKILRSKDEVRHLAIELRPLASGESYPLYDVSFDEKGRLTKDAMFSLDVFIQFLKDNPRLRIEIFAPKNHAAKIREYITKSGIRQDRIGVCVTPCKQTGYRLQ